MANFGQATFVGKEVVIECGEKMSCCQREQAKKKVESYNKEINNSDLPGPLSISPGTKGLGNVKSTAQSNAWRNLRSKMEEAKNRKEREQIAKSSSVSDCEAEAIVDKWEKGKTSSKDLGVQMDHLIEVKWGGPADPFGLLALNSRVNNFFGSISKRVGDDMLAQGVDEIEAVYLICNPPCPPPREKDKNNNYSTGPSTKHSEFPSAPSGPVRTYLQG